MSEFQKRSDGDGALIQPLIALTISGLVCGFHVLAAVKFDGEAQAWAIEIENEQPSRMLPPEVDAKLAIAQFLPQAHFDIRRVASQAAGKRGLSVTVLLKCDLTPTRLASLADLPLQGEVTERAARSARS